MFKNPLDDFKDEIAQLPKDHCKKCAITNAHPIEMQSEDCGDEDCECHIISNKG
jgi:hypothetical protein